MNPYREALAWISQSADTASAMGLAKLILSLSTSEAPFSLRECLEPLAAPQLRLALRISRHFAEQGEDSELSAVGVEVCRLYPRLVVLGQVMADAGRRQASVWRSESRAAEDARRQAGDSPEDA